MNERLWKVLTWACSLGWWCMGWWCLGELSRLFTKHCWWLLSHGLLTLHISKLLLLRWAVTSTPPLTSPSTTTVVCNSLWSLNGNSDWKPNVTIKKSFKLFNNKNVYRKFNLWNMYCFIQHFRGLLQNNHILKVSKPKELIDFSILKITMITSVCWA